MSRCRHRPADYVPTDLYQRARLISAERGHPGLASYWAGAAAAAASAAEAWLDAGKPGSSPLAAATTKADLLRPLEIRWTQTRAEEVEHDELIRAAGSNRTAVLTNAVERYVLYGGHMLSLMRRGHLDPTPLPVELSRLAAAIADCPAGCPLRVADPLTVEIQQLLSCHVSSSRADAP